MANDDSSKDNFEKIQHIRRMTRKVFLKAYNAFTRINDEDLKIVLERLLDSRYGRIYDKDQKRLIRAKKKENLDVNLLYMLIIEEGNLGDSAGCDLLFSLKQAKQLYHQFYNEPERLLYNPNKLQNMVSSQQEFLRKILNETEKGTSTSMILLRQQIMAEKRTATALSTSQENLFVLFNSILKVICQLIMCKIWNGNLQYIKDFVKSLKHPLSQHERHDIINCNSLREVPAVLLHRILINYFERQRSDSPLRPILKSMEDLRNKLCYDFDTYDNQNLSNKFFRLVEQVLQEFSKSSQQTSNLLKKLGNEIFPCLQHHSSLCCNQPTIAHPSAVTGPSTSATSSVISISIHSTVCSESIDNTSSTSSSHPTVSTLSVISIHSSIPTPATQQTTSSPGTIPMSPKMPESFHQKEQTTSSPGTIPMSPQMPESFHQKELNILKMFLSLGPEGPASLVYSTVIEVLCPEVTKSLSTAKICKQLNISDADMKHIQDNTPLPELDITLLDKLIRYGSNLDFTKCSDSADTLPHNLWCVKRMRNSLMHEKPMCTDNDVSSTFHTLRGHLERILELLKPLHNVKAHIDIPKVKENVQSKLESILKKTTASENLHDQWQRRLAIQTEWASENVTKAHKELQERCNKLELKLAPPIPLQGKSRELWSIPDLYTESEILNTEESGTANCKLALQNILTLSRSKTSYIILQGPAGSGKTTFCKYLVQCWNKRNNAIDGLGMVDLLIFIQCRDVCKDSKTLITYLKEDLLPDTLKTCSQDDIVLFLRDLRLLFVIDGFDEAGSAAQALVEDSLKKFPQATMIITTRPEFAPDVVELFQSTTNTSNYILLNMLGFEDKGRTEYIHKLFKEIFQSDPEPFLAYLKSMDTILGSFTKSPMTLAFLGLLWKENKAALTSSSTATKLYQEIIALYIKRDVKRHKLEKALTSNAIEKNIMKWTKAVGKIAWQAIKQKRSHIDSDEEDELRSVAKELGLNPDNVLSIVMQCEVRTNSTGNCEIWMFIHKSIQEFLAAQYLCNILPGSNIDDVFEFPSDQSQKKIKVKEYIQIITFVAGILVQKKSFSEVEAEQILLLLHFQMPWTFDEIKLISTECAQSQVFSQKLSHLFADETLPEQLEGYNLESLNFILNTTSLKVPVNTRIKITNSNVYKLGDLLDTLVSKGCHPEVEMSVRDAKSVTDLLSVLESVKSPLNIDIIFQFHFADQLPLLLDKWIWISPLHLKFPKIIFPLLWLHLISYMASKPLPISIVIYGGDNHLKEIVAIGANWLLIRHSSEEGQGFGDEIILRR